MSTRSEIESRLISWAKSQSPPILVAVENVTFDKPASASYLEIFFLDAHKMNRDVAATGIRTTGRFQVNCCSPLGTGMAVVETLAASVVSLYPVLPKVGTVSIEAPLEDLAGITVDGFMCVPVVGKYRVET